MDNVQENILETIAGIKSAPDGAYNIRMDGKSIGRADSENIKVTPKEDGTGLDVHILPGTKAEKVYIPVIVSCSGLVETVYNDFYIGRGADVEVIAGCGIHNCGSSLSEHDGIHRFFFEEDAHLTYIEKHYGSGDGNGKRVLNPITEVTLAKGSSMNMLTIQIEGVDSTNRITRAKMADNSSLVIKESLMTHGEQYARTEFDVDMDGENCSTGLTSRSVAKGNSSQIFASKINGNNSCKGHSECDAIIMDNASVQAIPEIIANHPDASLIHEAAIGKIAGDQIIKLMTLGLSEEEAIEKIVAGFLK